MLKISSATRYLKTSAIVTLTAITLATSSATLFSNNHKGDNQGRNRGGKKALEGAKNVIFFVGDGMGVSTVTATRIFAVGIDGNLIMDQFPFTALSRTATTDHITPDSAGTMTAMMSGINTNSGVIGFGPDTERRDFNEDGDGTPVTTILEEAKMAGMKVGVVSTARITHATPAACYAKSNERDAENEIALQALPTDPTYNTKLGDGIDLLFGGGRRHFVPAEATDEEGGTGSRDDGRDLRAEFQDAGYNYVWNRRQFSRLRTNDLPVLGLFERSHMEYEYDRPDDVGGEPSISEMTSKAISLLESATRGSDEGYFLMVESGRIDHAHHAGNAFRACLDADEFDIAIGNAANMVDLSETLIVVTADHSHVFTMAGYPMRAPGELPYNFDEAGSSEYYLDNDPSTFDGLFDVVYDISASSGIVSESLDSNGVPYTILGYHNGSGYRADETGPLARVDPREDTFLGLDGEIPLIGSEDPEYKQEAAVPLGSETHSSEEVAIYAIGPHSYKFRGTLRNYNIADIIRDALGFSEPL